MGDKWVMEAEKERWWRRWRWTEMMIILTETQILVLSPETLALMLL
jgi:hypothetical protein